MEVLHEGEELVFLYQLIEGATNSSYACHIAALAGLPAEITNRGSEVCALQLSASGPRNYSKGNNSNTVYRER